MFVGPEVPAGGQARLDPFAFVSGGLRVGPGGDVVFQKGPVRLPGGQHAGGIDQFRIALVPDDDAVFGVEIGDALGHRLDGLLQVGQRAPPAPAFQGDHVGDDQQRARGRGDADRQKAVGDDPVRGHATGQGDHGQGRHGGEMQPRHGEHEEGGRIEDRAAGMLGGHHGCGQTRHAHHQGGRDVGRVPAQQGQGLERPEADEMHEREAEAQHQSRGEGPGDLAALGGQGEGRCGAQDRHQERGGGAQGLVARAHRRRIGQHGHEVGRPHADAADQGGQRHPEHASAAGTRLGIGEESEGGQGRRDADQRCDDHKTQVVLPANTGQHFKHGAILPKRRHCLARPLTMNISFPC